MYGSKIYVVTVYNVSGLKPYGNQIAIFDLCKMGDRYNGLSFTDLFDYYNDCSIYADDGNTEIIEDCYGEKLTCTDDIKKVVEWLEEAENKETYRRAELFLDFLKTILKQQEQGKWGNIRLIHYGY